MTAKNLLLAAALAAAAACAQAYPTYKFEVHGSGLYAVGGTEGCSPAHPEECVHATDWTGILTVQTANSADGTYDIGQVVDNNWVPGGIIRVMLDSNVGGVDVDAQAFPGAQFFPDTFPYAVTIVGNRVTAIEWTSQDAPDGGPFLHVDGLAVTYQSSLYHEAYADVTGTLTAIPEPGAAALTWLGLVAVALGLRRAGVRRASPG